MINNVVTVSDGQQRDSATHIHVSTLPQTSPQPGSGGSLLPRKSSPFPSHSQLLSTLPLPPPGFPAHRITVCAAHSSLSAPSGLGTLSSLVWNALLLPSYLVNENLLITQGPFGQLSPPSSFRPTHNLAAIL